MAKYTPLYVSERIREWYHNIMAHRYEESTQNQMEAEMLIQDMEPDDKVISFFTLIKYKHQLTFENEEVTENKFEKFKRDTMADSALQLLVYDYAGQSAYYKGEYMRAISYYQKAEKLLPEITDVYEKADFYKRLGILFYKIKQNVMASMYLIKARDIFADNPFYKLNEVSCKIVLAGISSEGYNFESAEKQYESILAETTKFVPALQASVLQAMGIHYQRAKKLDKAATYYQEVLQLTGEISPIILEQSQIDLANIYFQQSKKDEANYLLNKGLDGALTLNDAEYICHGKALKHLYQEYNLEKIEIQLQVAEELELYSKAAEIAGDVAEYHKKAGNLDLALKYTELNSEFKIKLRTISEEVVTI
ncbi:hypothetical protein SFC15_12515 [Shouchella clausii]